MIWVENNNRGKERDLSDLLNTHQVQPTEVKTSRQGKDHHHSLDSKLTKSRSYLGREYHGFTLGYWGHGSHQQGWRICSSFKEFRGGTSTLKWFFELFAEDMLAAESWEYWEHPSTSTCGKSNVLMGRAGVGGTYVESLENFRKGTGAEQAFILSCGDTSAKRKFFSGN